MPLFRKLYKKIADRLLNIYDRESVRDINHRYGSTLKFIEQGHGGVSVVGKGPFVIDKTSHLKSNTYIDCSGGVYIGKYFHVGRGLTIFSDNHNWKSQVSIPYDSQMVNKPVHIGDAVWMGSNVTIMPGTNVGNGAIIGGGSVLRGEIAMGAIVIGNPVKIVGYRDIAEFNRMHSEGSFF